LHTTILNHLRGSLGIKLFHCVDYLISWRSNFAPAGFRNVRSYYHC
jgi:hypothetical protein